MEFVLHIKICVQVSVPLLCVQPRGQPERPYFPSSSLGNPGSWRWDVLCFGFLVTRFITASQENHSVVSLEQE